MRQIIGLSIAWSAIAFGMVHAAPARPLYQPNETPAPPTPKTFQLNDTVWLGKYNQAARTFIFEADGTLSYKSGTSKLTKGVKNRGFWRLAGNKLFFEHFINPNQKLMQFSGTVIDNNTIVGEAIYPLNNTKSQQTLQRTTAP